MGFSRQEYWNELPFPSPGDLPVLTSRYFTAEPSGKPRNPYYSGRFKSFSSGWYSNLLVNNAGSSLCKRDHSCSFIASPMTGDKQGEGKERWWHSPASLAILHCPNLDALVPRCLTAVGHRQWDVCFFFSFLNFILREFSGGLRLGLCVSMAAGIGLVPGQGTKIPHAAWHSQKKKKRKKIEKKKTLILKQYYFLT